MAQDLQRTDLSELSPDEKLAFFLNLYNAMVIHAVIRVGHPESIMDRRFFSDFQYVVGGHPYSLSTIHNGILRNNRRPPYSLVKPFGSEDKRLEVITFPIPAAYELKSNLTLKYSANWYFGRICKLH